MSNDPAPRDHQPPVGDAPGSGDDVASTAGHQAVALRYEAGVDRAPVVVATGRGMIADRILAVAAEHGIPIREDPDLIQLLARLDLGEEIPAQLYPIIAEVFAFVYRLNAEKSEVRRQKSEGGTGAASDS